MKPFVPPPTTNVDLDATREERRSLELVKAAAAEADGRLDAPTAAAIGPLSIETRTHQDHHDHWHQIRSEPLPKFGGAEFRYDVPRGRVLQAKPIVEGIVAAAGAFARNQDAVAAEAEAARGMAGRTLSRLTGAWSDPALVAVGIEMGQDGQPMRMVLEVRTLGHGLFPIAERLQARSLDALGAKLDALLDRHGRRARLRASLLADGAVGWVDETARRILATVGKDPRWAMGLLEQRGTVDLWFPVDPGSIHARVRWREGVLKTEYSNPGMKLHVEEDCVIMFRLLPARILAERIGGPVGRLTKDQFIPPEAILFDAVRQGNGRTALTLAIPKTSIPLAKRTGRPAAR